jgi:hypothetical protein
MYCERSALDAAEFTCSCMAGFDALALQDDRRLQLPVATLRSMWTKCRTLSSLRHDVGISTHSTLPNCALEPEILFDTPGVPTYYQRIQLTVF